MNRKLIVTLVSLFALVVVGAAAAHEFNRIKGTHGNDGLTGTESADRIRALAGDDTVNALGGNDRVWAGPGNDTVDGGAGRDRLRGGNGNDNLNGGEDNDVIRGRHGDTVNGGNGNDTVRRAWRRRLLRRRRRRPPARDRQRRPGRHARLRPRQRPRLAERQRVRHARELREGLHRDHHECGRRGRRVDLSRPLGRTPEGLPPGGPRRLSGRPLGPESRGRGSAPTDVAGHALSTRRFRRRDRSRAARRPVAGGLGACACAWEKADQRRVVIRLSDGETI